MKFLFLPLITLFALTVGFSAQADDYSKAIDDFKSSKSTREFFQNAYGYAVFPTVGKGGVTFGAAYGRGQVYVSDQAVGKSSVVQLSFGLQLGGQLASQIIFFQNKSAFDEFSSGSFEFSAGASAVALTAGAQAQAGTSGISSSQGPDSASTSHNKIIYRKGMAVMTIAKGGLMYEAALAGQKYSYTPLRLEGDEDNTQ